MNLKDLIISMSGEMSVTGYEYLASAKLDKLLIEHFDEKTTDAAGNIIYVKKCNKENAPKILIDAHLDEIGMFVTGISDDGFLSVVNVGGLDTRILQAAEVVIYGKEKLYGVIASTPPHLQSGDDEKQLLEMSELLIDTGYKKEELEKLIRIGTPVGYKPRYTELLNSQIAGKGFDDKACGACAAWGIINTPREKMAGDVYLQLSVHEETDREGGALAGAFAVSPDYAMIIDVNLGRTPDTPKHETVEIGKGYSISLSAVTDRKLTKMSCELSDECGFAYQKVAAPSHTGTNATAVQLARGGIPTVDVGLPLKSMHTYNEVISLDDAKVLADFVGAFISSEKIAEVFGK